MGYWIVSPLGNVSALPDPEALAAAALPINDDSTPDGALPYRRLLARQLTAHCHLRFGVTLLIVLGTLFAERVVGVRGLPVSALFATAAALALLNVFANGAIVHWSRLSPVALAHRRLFYLRHATILTDYLSLALLIHLVGGARSPFLAVFLLHIMLGSMMVSRLMAFGYAGIAVILVNAIVFGELCGCWIPFLPEGAVASQAPIDSRYAISVAVVYSFLFAVTTFLLTALAGAMRRVERDLVASNAELANLSAARRDFLHVALHDLKSPLAAVTMLLENLGLGLAGPLAPPQQDLVDRARRRIAESDRFLRDLAVLASLEGRDLASLDERVDVAGLMRRIVDEHQELASGRSQTLELGLPSNQPLVRGNERLLHEAVANLVTNAIKFSPRGGTIHLSVAVTGPAVEISVTDAGPGIPPQHHGRLFHEFARLDTVLPDGERPPGSGLGLSIVKRIAKGLGGDVRFATESGVGTTFTLRLLLVASPQPPADGSSVSPPSDDRAGSADPG
ncbi:MAG: hypothetical protein JW751_23135 [Polyangiaceae bacterium]|nr:hypothetical protein [Polyangiaceae bacterium]